MKTERKALCHPDRKHWARDMCSKCYQQMKNRVGFVVVGRTKAVATCGHDRNVVHEGKCQTCYARDWRKRNPEADRKSREMSRLKRYGLTIESFSEMLKRQRDRCALCGVPFDTSLRRNMHVDHCHDTGKVRGILCFGCNKGLGMLGDNEAGLLRALAYLRGKEQARAAA